ncbi:hypothetical protein EG327_010963, partial [Venturia inaequalis]
VKTTRPKATPPIPTPTPPAMPSTGSRLYLDVLHKPPRSEISNLGLIQVWITRKALGDRHPIALELYGDRGASYGALLNVIQHVIKTELAQEVKPPRGNNGMDFTSTLNTYLNTDVDTEVDINENKSPQNTDDEAMDEEEMDDEDSQANFGTPIQY